MRILVVEDSPRLGSTLASGLTRDGHPSDLAADGVAALAFLERYPYDVIVLDLMLPRVDGLQVLKTLRLRGIDSRVLVLSARDQVDDRVQALNLGADDYLTKPFSYEELLARLYALLRRGGQGDVKLRVGTLELDPHARLAQVDQQPLALTPKEFALLELLLRERGRVLSRTAIFERLYDATSASSDKVVEVVLSTLRAKLARAGVGDLIGTRRGFGYVLE